MLMGADVVTPRRERLGEIRDAVIDARRARVTYCVLACGGFLGMGQKYLAVPFAALAYDVGQGEFVLDITPERLATAPGFDSSQWPHFSDASWGRQIHQFYQVQPYWERALQRASERETSASH